MNPKPMTLRPFLAIAAPLLATLSSPPAWAQQAQTPSSSVPASATVAQAATAPMVAGLPSTPAAASTQQLPAGTSAAAPAAPTFVVAWKDGKTTIETDHVAVTIFTQLQPRSTFEDPSGGTSRGSFRIRRAKTRFEGWVYHPNLSFEFQANWASPKVLDDALFNWDVTGKKLFQVRAGQFKVPFGRQELTSDGSQEFVDRSIVSDEFAKGRDIGLQLWGSVAGSRLEYRLGAFNGAGFGNTVTGNDNTKLQYAARLMLQPFGEVKYSEVDLESKDHPLLAVAVEYESNDMRGSTDGNDLFKRTFGADAVLKFHGLFVFAEGFAGKRTPETGDEFDNRGFNVQTGFAFAGRRLELAGRYAQLDPNTAKDADLRTERGIALSYLYNKHSLKLTGDVRQLKDQSKPDGQQTSVEVRTQLQFTF